MGEVSEKLTRIELKRATGEVERLMSIHCGVKRLPRLVRWFIKPEAYALHVQRRFNMMPERDQLRMKTIGEKIKKHTKKKRLVLDRLKIVETAKNSGLEKANGGE